MPVAPFDGQRVVFLADAAKGVVWDLVYRAASPSAYKWEAARGGALVAWVPGPATRGVASAIGDFVVPGPSVVVPRAGDYVVAMSANVTATGGVAGSLHAIDAWRSTGGGSLVAQASWNAPAANFQMTIGVVAAPCDGLAAGDVVRMQGYTQTSILATFDSRSLSVTPVRVA